MPITLITIVVVINPVISIHQFLSWPMYFAEQRKSCSLILLLLLLLVYTTCAW